MKNIFLIISIILTTTVVYSQPNFEKHKEMIKSERIAFLTSKLNLSPAEAEKFWPVYNEYINKQEEIISQKRENMHNFAKNKDNITDEQAKKVVDTYILLTKQESDLFIEYNKKIENILPIKKVALLYQAEKQFKRHLMRKMQNGRKKH